MRQFAVAPNTNKFTLITYQYQLGEPYNFIHPPIEKIGFHYSIFAKVTIVGVNELVDDVSLKLYPSPSSSVLNISSDNLLNSSVNLIITNFLGEEVFTAKDFISNRFKVDVSKFSNGVYFASLVNGSNKITKQFVIAK